MKQKRIGPSKRRHRHSGPSPESRDRDTALLEWAKQNPLSMRIDNNSPAFTARMKKPPTP